MHASHEWMPDRLKHPRRLSQSTWKSTSGLSGAGLQRYSWEFQDGGSHVRCEPHSTHTDEKHGL